MVSQTKSRKIPARNVLPLFFVPVQIWSANGSGESLGAGEAIEATLAAWRGTFCELLAAQAAAQQKQAPAGSKAKRRKTGRSTKK